MPLGFLIAAPLRALIQGQALAEMETINFITDVGLTAEGKAPDEKRQAVRLEFEIMQPVPNPEWLGEVEFRPATVSAPLLSLVRIPSMHISEATVSFDITVTGTIPREQSASAEGDKPGGPMDLYGVLGMPARRSIPSMRISIKVQSTGEEANLQALKRLLSDATTAFIAEKPEKEPEPPPTQQRPPGRRTPRPRAS